MLVTRRVDFSASHVCSLPSLSEEENRALYGAGANPRGHGHNYVLEVTLEGEPDPVTGMVFDLKRLKEIINDAMGRKDVSQRNVDQLDVHILATKGRREEAVEGVERALSGLREAMGVGPPPGRRGGVRASR